MFNQFTASLDFGRRQSSRSAAWAVFIRDTVRGFTTTAHHTLMIFGLGAIAALALVFVKPGFADQLKALSPFNTEAPQTASVPAPDLAHLMDMPAQPFAAPLHENAALTRAALKPDLAPAHAANAPIDPNHQQQRWVTEWLAKRYHVANDATNMLVGAAYDTAQQIKLDPLLILSVMAIESGFNPFAESPVGAQGLMQVMSKIHQEKFHDLGGIKAALNPVANIKVGSLILKDYVTRGGSVEAGLKLYVGAAPYENDAGYGARVLAEYHRLKDVSMGKNVPLFSTNSNVVLSKPHPQGSPIEIQPGVAPAESAPASTDQVRSAPVRTEEIAVL